jgi:hypothetical protein
MGRPPGGLGLSFASKYLATWPCAAAPRARGRPHGLAAARRRRALSPPRRPCPRPRLRPCWHGPALDLTDSLCMTPTRNSRTAFRRKKGQAPALANPARRPAPGRLPGLPRSLLPDRPDGRHSGLAPVPPHGPCGPPRPSSARGRERPVRGPGLDPVSAASPGLPCRDAGGDISPTASPSFGGLATAGGSAGNWPWGPRPTPRSLDVPRRLTVKSLERRPSIRGRGLRPVPFLLVSPGRLRQPGLSSATRCCASPWPPTASPSPARPA